MIWGFRTVKDDSYEKVLPSRNLTKTGIIRLKIED
jgi:hypothetical protein